MDQLVSFVVGGEEYGVDVLSVQEIIRPTAVTRVPNAPDGVEGVINLRGRVIPVLELRGRFGLPARPPDREARVIVVETGGQVVGLRVDRVREVIRIDRSTVEPAPGLALGEHAAFIRGIARVDERLLILVDLDRLLAEEARPA